MVCKQIRGCPGRKADCPYRGCLRCDASVSSLRFSAIKPAVKTTNIDSVAVALSDLADSSERQILFFPNSVHPASEKISAVGGDLHLVPRLRMPTAIPSLWRGALRTGRTTVYRCAGLLLFFPFAGPTDALLSADYMTPPTPTC
jgi:hypothetical protein